MPHEFENVGYLPIVIDGAYFTNSFPQTSLHRSEAKIDVEIDFVEIGLTVFNNYECCW